MPFRVLPTANLCQLTDQSNDLLRLPRERLRRPKPDASKSIASPKSNPKSCMDAGDRIRPATAIGKSKGSQAIFDRGFEGEAERVAA